MKEYPKTYENVFQGERKNKNVDIMNVSFTEDITLSEYIAKLKGTANKFQEDYFDALVKYNWLARKFRYKDKLRGMDLFVKIKFSIFCKEYGNFNQRIFTNDSYFNKITTYIDDLFPDFDLVNPFEIKYEYPFKYMSFDCLYFVYQLPDRMEFLKIGEERKMSYKVFGDYVINQVLCRNDESGIEEYTLKNTSKVLIPPFIRYENYENNNRYKIKRRPRGRPRNQKAKTSNLHQW